MHLCAKHYDTLPQSSPLAHWSTGTSFGWCSVIIQLTWYYLLRSHVSETKTTPQYYPIELLDNMLFHKWLWQIVLETMIIRLTQISKRLWFIFEMLLLPWLKIGANRHERCVQNLHGLNNPKVEIRWHWQKCPLRLLNHLSETN